MPSSFFLFSKFVCCVSRSRFLGLNDRALEAGYTWSDKSPVSFLNWLPGEPNDDSFIENCVEMSAGSFLWKDNICTKFNSYICKQPLGTVCRLGCCSVTKHLIVKFDGSVFGLAHLQSEM